MSKKDPRSARCEYCGAEFKTSQPAARFCKPSHRVYAFNKRRMQKLKELEALHGQ